MSIKDRLNTLNILREKAGKTPLKSWKESRDKLEKAIEDLTPPKTTPVTEAKGNDVITLADLARELKRPEKVVRAKFRRLWATVDHAKLPPRINGGWKFAAKHKASLIELDAADRRAK